MAYDAATTEELARLVRMLIQLREIRNFCRVEVGQAVEIDTYLWVDTHHTLVQSIKMTDKLIGGLMPSGTYLYHRDARAP